MRFLQLVVVACIAGSSGCSAFVLGSGKDLDQLTTRADVRKTFGTPIALGETDGRAFEEFTTHRKLSEKTGEGLVIAFMGTLGLSELYFFPMQSFAAVRHSVLGQKLRFFYDPQGNITRVTRNGDGICYFPKPPTSDASNGTGMNDDSGETFERKDLIPTGDSKP